MNVKFLQGSSLPTTGIVDGALYFVTSENDVQMYLGKGNTTLPITAPVIDTDVPFDITAANDYKPGTFVYVHEGDSTGEPLPSDGLYIIIAGTNGNQIIQLKGLEFTTDIQGDGNAITNVYYDDVNNILKFTKGETFATKTQLDGKAGLAADNTFSGKNTFSQNITVPATPVAETDAASKKYVDDLDAENVKLTGTQTINGNKIFKSAVSFQADAAVTGKLTLGSAPETNDAATNKEYVDTTVNTASTTIENKLGGTVYNVTTDSTDIAEISKGITGKAGDVIIATNTSGVTSAYMFDKKTSKWVACSGNVDASAVILKDDITLAGNYTQVGNLTKAQSGTGTFATAGKSVADALTEIFSKRLQPNKTEPSVTLTFSQAKSYEVGTKVTPSYSATLNAGGYTYGPATGITATAWEVTDTDSHSATTATGSFAQFTVGDATSYKITAKATYGAGAIAKDNLGSNSNPVVQIAAGSKTATSGAVTGYRSFFYGVLDTTDALTSAAIRGLTNGGAYNGQKTFTINATATAKRIVIAVPSSTNRGGLKSVILTSAMNTPVTDSYVKTAKAVKVEGVGGYTAVDYDVWVYQPASIDAGEVHAVTLA